MLSKLTSSASLWALPFEGEGWTNSGIPLHSKVLPAMTWIPLFLFPRIVWLVVPSLLFWCNCGLITVYPCWLTDRGAAVHVFIIPVRKGRLSWCIFQEFIVQNNWDGLCIKPDTYAVLTKMLSEKIVSFPDTAGCLGVFICYWAWPYEFFHPFTIVTNTGSAHSLLGV